MKALRVAAATAGLILLAGCSSEEVDHFRIAAAESTTTTTAPMTTTTVVLTTTTTTTALATGNALERSICVRLNEIAGYGQMLLEMRMAEHGNLAAVEDDPRYAQMENQRVESSIALSKLAAQVTDPGVAVAVRAIATLHTTGSAPYGLQTKMPEIADRLATDCRAMGHPITTALGGLDLL